MTYLSHTILLLFVGFPKNVYSHVVSTNRSSFFTQSTGVANHFLFNLLTLKAGEGSFYQPHISFTLMTQKCKKQ